MIWGNLLHLSYNMWVDRDAPEMNSEYIAAKPYLRFDYDLWSDLLRKMADVGMNMVVIDLGDGVAYKSHPEIAVKDAWTIVRLRRELAIAREMGLEPIPKLNFSTTHDAWLGPYSRCVSTDVYYGVCRDLIAEVIDLFDKPRFFHLGMDEERLEYQDHYEYALARQFDLWWHDLDFFIEQVEKGGSRAWIWSDYVWHKPDVFYDKMPKSVLQSNWYYGLDFNPDIVHVKAYHDLESHNYDQIPTGSNYSLAENFEKTVAYCKKVIAPERLLGFLQTPWKPTVSVFRDHHIQAIEVVGRAITSSS